MSNFRHARWSADLTSVIINGEHSFFVGSVPRKCHREVLTAIADAYQRGVDDNAKAVRCALGVPSIEDLDR